MYTWLQDWLKKCLTKHSEQLDSQYLWSWCAFVYVTLMYGHWYSHLQYSSWLVRIPSFAIGSAAFLVLIWNNGLKQNTLSSWSSSRTSKNVANVEINLLNFTPIPIEWTHGVSRCIIFQACQQTYKARTPYLHVFMDFSYYRDFALWDIFLRACDRVQPPLFSVHDNHCHHTRLHVIP